MGKVTEKIRVVAPDELDAAIKKRIEKIFSGKHREPVQFVYEKDSSLIGGILIIDGNNYYNSSVRGRLDKIKMSL